jgi:hypothetical protein
MSSNHIVFLSLAVVAVCSPAQARVYVSVEQAQKLMFGEQSLAAHCARGRPTTAISSSMPLSASTI